MTKDEKERLKLIETELAYLRKTIEQLIEQKPVEIHYHYYYDYESIMSIINQSFEENM